MIMGDRIYSHWLRTVAGSPGKVAIRDADESNQTTFREIQERVETSIGVLREQGLCGNRVIAFQLQNSAQWMVRFLACQATSNIAMPIDPDAPVTAVESIASHVRASAIWTQSGLRLLRGGSVRLPACLIKLTSGSTGEPRPLVFLDEQMLADGHNVMQSMGITEYDSNLATIPFGHSYGLGNLIMPCIMKGCSIHVCHDPFPHALAASVAQTKPSVYPTVPALLKALIRSGISPVDMQSIRLWISAGSTLDASVAVKFRDLFNKPVHNFYGSSETGGIAYDRSGNDTLSGRSVGTPLEGVQVSLSRANRLLVASGAVFTRNNRIRRGSMGAYMLPDSATVMADGSIRLQGRKDRTVKLSGKRLSLAEVEKALLDIEGIEACYVDEYTDSNGRNRVGAVIVSSRSMDAIQSRIKDSLATWKIPTRWIRVEELAVTSRGKLDRSRLQRLIQGGVPRLERP